MNPATSLLPDRSASLADRLLGPTRPSRIDRLRQTPSWAIQAAAILGFALLTAAAAQVRFLPPGWSVPITLQTLVVYSAGLWLGARNGSFSMLLYLALGLFFPVYAGGEGGVEHLSGPTAGYLFGYILAPVTAGLLTRRFNGALGICLSLVASSITLFTLGVAWLWLSRPFTLGEAIWQGWGVFILIDLAKLLLVAVAYGGSRYVTRDS